MWKLFIISSLVCATFSVPTNKCPAKNDAETTLPVEDPNTSCKHDPNAKIGCLGRCHRTCDDYERDTQEFAFECIHVCIPACDCKSGFVFDQTKKLCVTTDECPAKNNTETRASAVDPYESCRNDPNAYIGCAGRCHRTCDDYERKKFMSECIHACIPACDCKSGFVYDKTTELCVTTDKCPAKNNSVEADSDSD